MTKESDCTYRNTKTLLMGSQNTFRKASPYDLSNALVRVAVSQPINIFNIIEPFRPVLDDEFPESLLEFFRAGKWQTDKEVIIGVTTEEVANVNVFLQNVTLRRNLFEVCKFLNIFVYVF